MEILRHVQYYTWKKTDNRLIKLINISRCRRHSWRINFIIFCHQLGGIEWIIITPRQLLNKLNFEQHRHASGDLSFSKLINHRTASYAGKLMEGKIIYWNLWLEKMGKTDNTRMVWYCMSSDCAEPFPYGINLSPIKSTIHSSFSRYAN